MGLFDDVVWPLGVEQRVGFGGVVGCSALVTFAGSTVLWWAHRMPREPFGRMAWEWTVTSLDTGREWRSSSGGYGGSVDDEGRFDGEGGWQFEVAPAAGAVVRIRGSADAELVFDHLVELRPAEVEPLDVLVLEVSDRPLRSSFGLIRAFREAGRAHRVVPDRITAVQATCLTHGDRELLVVTVEHWAEVRGLLVQLSGPPWEPVPQWWLLEIDGVEVPAFTQNLQSATGGQIGHLAIGL